MNKVHDAYHILIVDDVSTNIKIAANILRQEEYKLFFAVDGSSALDQVRTRKFDLILLDVMLPDIEGFEICKQIRSDPATKDIPIIFLTGKTDTESIVKGFEVGAMDYVTKPFKGAELLARVKTHLELCRAKEELKELNATKDKFFSILAHDLRSPFTSLLGLTDLLFRDIERYSKDEVVRFVGSMRNSAKRLFTLLENLLAWSRLQRGLMEHHPEYISLYQIAGYAMSLFQSGAEHKQIVLNNLIPEDMEAYGDSNMIETVFRNLVSNALKFTESGGAIEMSSTQNEHTVEVAVSDTGVGMSAAALSSLFRIDVKYSNVGTAGEKGTGLGLILCKELIELHRGRIWVDSEEGKGSTFRFTLPGRHEEQGE
jgi:signal transduction histidine kinase